MKKNIIVFVKNLTSGGAEKQAVLLAKSLCEDCNVHFVVFNGGKVHEKYLRMLDGTSVKIKMFMGGHLSRFFSFTQYLRKNNVDVIFSYLAAADMYASLAGRFAGCRVYTSLRNSDISKGRRIAGRLMTNVLASGTVSNCFSGKETVIKYGFNRNKILVVPNCFEHISDFSQKPEKDNVDIITVGRFVAQKDYEIAIKSIYEVRKVYPNICFHIVGWGELEQQIRLWIKQYKIDDITYMYINPDNISELLDNSDIYVSTSWKEGTSNSIMEGMNANLPIVATDAGDNKYLVHDNENGFICTIGDYLTISRKIIFLCQNKKIRDKMGECGKEILRRDYSIEVFRNKYLNIIG